MATVKGWVRVGRYSGWSLLGLSLLTADIVDHRREHLLCESDEVVVVGVGPVEFARGELGVVRHVHALVPEEACAA